MFRRALSLARSECDRREDASLRADSDAGEMTRAASHAGPAPADPETGDVTGDPETGDPETGDVTGDPETGDVTGDPETGDVTGDPETGDVTGAGREQVGRER